MSQLKKFKNKLSNTNKIWRKKRKKLKTKINELEKQIEIYTSNISFLSKNLNELSGKYDKDIKVYKSCIKYADKIINQMPMLEEVLKNNFKTLKSELYNNLKELKNSAEWSWISNRTIHSFEKALKDSLEHAEKNNYAFKFILPNLNHVYSESPSAPQE